MKKRIKIIASVTAFLVLAGQPINSQSKYDYVWINGYDSTLDDGIEGLCFDFNNSLNTEKCESALEFYLSNASICDDNGKLLLYTNGCKIANGNHQIIENGDSINYGPFLEYFWDPDCQDGYPGGQDHLILNDPANDKGYYLIHKTVDIGDPRDIEISIQDIKYTYISFEHNPNGSVLEKNVPFFEEEVLWSYLTAIRHSNKSDWWIIQPSVYKNQYCIFLLDENGISLNTKIEIGPELGPEASAAGFTRFSPDGTKYAFFNLRNGLLLYDFDRSTGIISNLKTLDPIKEDSILTSIEFSPNSNYLYITARDTLWQVDLSIDDLNEGLEFIDEWDGSLDPFPTYFYKLLLGPDCKIYVSTTSSSNTFHVINQPNEKGKACEFIQRGIELPVKSSVSNLPNFPRFRVDETEVCDSTITSLFGKEIFIRKDLKAFPNPVSDIINIELPEGVTGTIKVYNTNLQLIKNYGLIHSPNDIITLNVNEIPLGSYFIEFEPFGNTSNIIYSTKIIVSR